MIPKTLQQRLLYFLFAFLFVLVLLPKQTQALCVIDTTGTYIEAENFSRSSNLDSTPQQDDYFEVKVQDNQNGGKIVKSGDNGYAADTPGKDVLEYDVNFPVAGTYRMWMRGRGKDSNKDSMFFTVDDATPLVWKAWNFNGVYEQWIWTSSMQVGADNTVDVATAGNHTIKIAMREPRTRIDGFYITMGAETPTDATVPSTVTSISPKDGCSGSAWTVDPGSLDTTCFKGYNAASTEFTITNTGNLDDGSTATVSSSDSWVVIPDNNVPALAQNASHSVTITFNTAAKSPGTHTATLTITGGANNSPYSLTVNLLVKDIPSTAACGEIPLYAENLINPAIMVQLDTSGSMSNNMDIGGGQTMSRIAIAEDVLKEVFLDRSIAWGFATWAGGNGNEGDGDGSPNYYTNYRVGVHEHDATHQTVLQDKADDGSPSGWTPLAPSMRGGLEYFKGNRNDGNYGEKYAALSCQPRILVVITDGQGNTGTNNTKIDSVVNDLIAEGVTIVAVGFGLSNADQLDRIVQKMQTKGNESEDDYLYHLHKEDTNGVAVPFMAQNRQEFIDAMNNIVTNVKAQVFHGSSPAPTTSVDNGAIVLNAAFDASNWTGNISATKFNIFTGLLETTPAWETKDEMPATINGFIPSEVIVDGKGVITPYTTDSITGDNFLCKPMGDIINSTPAIIGSPPFFYNFNDYFNFKYNATIRSRDELAYVGANDGALHAFKIKDGTEKWRFYPESVKAKMANALTVPAEDMCSAAYCHMFLLDGSPEPADIYVDATTGWRTILTTGLGEGGSAFFALDVTYGEDFDAPAVDSVAVKSKYLWEFTNTDDALLGLATSWPSIERVKSVTNATGWATFFGSGKETTDLLQAEKEAYLFAVNSWDKTKVWINGDATPASVYHAKLASGTLKNDLPAPLLVVDTLDDDYQSDRIYVGNMYGNMYRVKDIGFGEKPVSELLYNSEKTDHSTPVSSKAAFAYAGDNDVWLYFGTGKYVDQIDKFTVDQQYMVGLFDEKAATSTAYKKSDLVESETNIIEAYAVDEYGVRVDLNNDGNVDTDDLLKYRTLSCTSPDGNGYCNADKKSWIIKLATPAGVGSERVISQPLIVGGIAFFTTFVPDGDVCEGNGDTWLFAVDWKTGEPVSNEVFDLNGNGEFDSGDKSVSETPDSLESVAGIYVGTGKPPGEIIIYNDILLVGTTDDPTKTIKVNLPGLRTRLRSWQQTFN